jgi:hypothetical protein
MDQGTTDRILIALYRLTRDTCPIDAGALARAAGLRTIAAAQALIELERAGLADATRARLTMFGLARAARLDAAAGPVPLRAVRTRSLRKTRTMSPLAAAETEPPPSDSDDDPLRYPDESEENPLEQPLRKPLYRPLRKPIYGQRVAMWLH